MGSKLKAFMKREIVLTVSLAAAVVSMFFVPPSRAYSEYINAQVLAVLWCLMLTVALFRRCGVFEVLTVRVLRLCRGNSRALSVFLVMLPFFTSMLVTNDVALLTFVPFTLGVLKTAGCQRAAAPMLALQTAAAMMGCIASPVGDPHNLYLYAYYHMELGEFFAAVLPFVGVSALGFVAAALPLLPKKMPEPKLWQTPPIPRGRFAVYTALFALSLLTVLRVLPWLPVLLVTAVTVFFLDRPRLLAPDYALLLTFLCFFIFSGNLGEIPAVRDFLRGLMERDALLTSVLTSQVISNVPAAVLLAPFTQDARALMVGTGIGGLGTPIASMANLITIKLYLGYEGHETKRFFAYFALVNVVGLVMMLALAWIIW